MTGLGVKERNAGIVFVVDRYTEYAKALKEMMRKRNIHMQMMALTDDGFLPEEIISPYRYYVSMQNLNTHVDKELFYAFLEIPEFWEIRTEGVNGAIYDMGRKRATIYFTKPIEKRRVQRVEWYMENGRKYKTDFYNKAGMKYAGVFWGVEGKVESRVFYSDRNQEVIVEQPQNDCITLQEKGKLKHFFTSYKDFLLQCLNEIAPAEKHVLFLQDEEIRHLQWLEQDGKNLWDYILFLDNELLDRYLQDGGKNGLRFFPLNDDYSVNRARGEALILTASDQLEGIEQMICELPEMIFHIAANTQVSDRLWELTRFINVRVYPQIGRSELNELWERCDFYLDVNYYREINHAIPVACGRNLLIMGFEETLHGREVTGDSCIFRRQDCEKLIQELKKLINHTELVQMYLEEQQQKARNYGKCYTV